MHRAGAAFDAATDLNRKRSTAINFPLQLFLRELKACDQVGQHL